MTRKSVLLMLEESFWSELSHRNTVLIGLYKTLLLFQQNHQQHHCHTTSYQKNHLHASALPWGWGWRLMMLLWLLLLASPRESIECSC
jgi:hypothetical protein